MYILKNPKWTEKIFLNRKCLEIKKLKMRFFLSLFFHKRSRDMSIPSAPKKDYQLKYQEALEVCVCSIILACIEKLNITLS